VAKARTLVGLDVHAAKIVAAVLDAETGELQWFRVSGDIGEAAALCAGLPRPVRAAYEAGPTGYGLARELERRGVRCVVAAPSKIPRASGDRVKTDRRDAEHLVRLLLAGKLHPVRVPGLEEEALRDLVRAREAVRVDLMRCRHRLSKLLLRRGIRFDDGRAWTERHRTWLAGVDLGHSAAQATLADAIGAVDALVHRRDRLERAIVARLPDSPWQADVGRLRCLRGVDTLTAAGLCAEIGDFARFARAEQLMHYLGLVPSENSTAERPGTTASAPPSARPSPPASTARAPTRLRSPGQRSTACTAPGSGSSSAPSAAPSSPSPPPASSPASPGRSPPAPSNPPPPIPSAGSVAARHTRGEPAK
jgi:transposase